MTEPIERSVEAAFAAMADLVDVDDAAGRFSDVGVDTPAGRASVHRRRWRWTAPVAAAAIVAGVAGAVALGRGSTHTAAPLAGSPQSTPTGSVRPNPTTHRTASPPAGAGRPFVAPSHCGIKFIRYAGRNWEAVHPIAEPATRPDARGDVSLTGGTPGTITRIGKNTLRFAIDESKVSSPAKVVVFHPTSKSIPLCA